MFKVEVCHSPKLYAEYENKDAIVVVIDIFRATTAIATAFESGIKELIPVATVDEAMQYKNKGFLAGAERGGQIVEGFDFGNSPLNFLRNKDAYEGKSVVLTTTNGTKAIDIAKESKQVIIGAFSNFTAVSEYLLSQDSDVLLLCAGWKDRFNLEDTLFAGAVARKLVRYSDKYTTIDDSTYASTYLFEQVRDDLQGFLKLASHGKRLEKLNLQDDIEYCLRFDTSNVVPALQGNALVPIYYK